MEQILVEHTFTDVDKVGLGKMRYFFTEESLERLHKDTSHLFERVCEISPLGIPLA